MTKQTIKKMMQIIVGVLIEFDVNLKDDDLKKYHKILNFFLSKALKKEYANFATESLREWVLKKLYYGMDDIKIMENITQSLAGKEYTAFIERNGLN